MGLSQEGVNNWEKPRSQDSLKTDSKEGEIYSTFHILQTNVWKHA